MKRRRNLCSESTLLQGDVQGEGFDVIQTHIREKSITNDKMAEMPTLTFKGNELGTNAPPQDLLISSIGTLMVPDFDNTQRGLVPASVDDNNVLLGDATWGLLPDASLDLMSAGVKGSIVTPVNAPPTTIDFTTLTTQLDEYSTSAKGLVPSIGLSAATTVLHANKQWKAVDDASLALMPNLTVKANINDTAILPPSNVSLSALSDKMLFDTTSSGTVPNAPGTQTFLRSDTSWQKVGVSDLAPLATTGLIGQLTAPNTAPSIVPISTIVNNIPIFNATDPGLAPAAVITDSVLGSDGSWAKVNPQTLYNCNPLSVRGNVNATSGIEQDITFADLTTNLTVASPGTPGLVSPSGAVTRAYLASGNFEPVVNSLNVGNSDGVTTTTNATNGSITLTVGLGFIQPSGLTIPASVIFTGGAVIVDIVPSLSTSTHISVQTAGAGFEVATPGNMQLRTKYVVDNIGASAVQLTLASTIACSEQRAGQVVTIQPYQFVTMFLL